MYSCVYKTYKEWGQAKINMEPLFQSSSMRVGKKKYLSVTVCPACKCIERHPCSCRVRTMLSVTVSANSCSCHQSTQCLRGFNRIQLEGYVALTAFFCFLPFFFTLKLTNSFHIFFLLTFYSIDFIRN